LLFKTLALWGAWMWVLFVNLSSILFGKSSLWQKSVMTTTSYHDVNKVSNLFELVLYALLLQI
jgi:hypothetical protein